MGFRTSQKYSDRNNYYVAKVSLHSEFVSIVDFIMLTSWMFIQINIYNFIKLYIRLILK